MYIHILLYVYIHIYVCIHIEYYIYVGTEAQIITNIMLRYP